MKCQEKGCEQELTLGVLNYSSDVYGRALCYFHQQEQRRKDTPKLDKFMREIEEDKKLEHDKKLQFNI